MGVVVEVCLYVLVFCIHLLVSLHVRFGSGVQKRKPVVPVNHLSKLYVRVDRVKMVMELFYVALSMAIIHVLVPPS